jgi:hypothetical protein
VSIQFKDIAQMDEFNDLTVIEPRLYGMVLALANFCETQFHKDLVITDVFRPGNSGPHGQGRAVDVRAHWNYWTPEELNRIGLWLRRHFPRSDMRALERTIDGWIGTLRHHGENAEEHLHLCVEPLGQFRTALGVDS